MKKLTRSALMLALALLLLAAPLTVSAMTAVGDMPVGYGKPTIDGVINADEWATSTSFVVDSKNAKTWTGEFKVSIKMNTLWDETGLYLAGEISDADVTPVTSGYGADGFQISLDLGQSFVGSGEARAIFYSFGCFEDGNAVLVRQESNNNAEVANGENGFSIKTVKTSTGWLFEALLPWAMLKEDNNLKSGKDFTVAPEAKINALICYLDGDAGAVASAFGTTKTDESVAFDWGPDDHGITFILKAQPVPETTAEETAPTTPEAPETSDTGIIVFALLLGVSLVSFTVMKKRNT
ncbi:MAG: sugar-binding protein [Eubacteriales bacterium]